MSSLNIYTALTSYVDTSVNNNPSLRDVDWRRSFEGVEVDTPISDSLTIAPGASTSFLNNLRTLSTDGTTAFDLTQNPTNASVYRLTWVSGTNPVFRTDRAIDLTGIEITVAVNNNATATFEADSGTPFASVVVGDILLIPNVATGDSAGPFTADNGGYWSIIAKTNTKLTCKRLAGVSFSGIDEVVPAITTDEFRVFSNAGIQVDDTVILSAGFSSVTFGNYSITAVANDFIEFFSASPIPLESAVVPTAPGITIFYQAKRFLYLESTERLSVRINGSTGDLNLVEPELDTPEGTTIGVLLKCGLVYALTLVNLSQTDYCKVPKIILAG